MTISLRDVAVQQFRDKFQLLYAAPRQIRGTTLEVRNVVGDAYKWPQMGSTPMIVRGASQSIIPASDVSHPRVDTTFTDYVLNTPTDIFDQAEVNADERSMLAVRHVEAAGRREDQVVINAANASAASTILNGGTNLTVDKLREASSKLTAKNVPSTDRAIIIHANQLQSLLQDPEATSQDFVSVKNLMNGSINTYMGFKFITIGDRPDEGGLPLAAGIRTCFVYNKMAMGVVWKINPTISVTFSDERVSWLTISRMSLGGNALQDDGIVKIECDES